MIVDRAKRVAREGNVPLNESEPSLTVGLVPRRGSGSAQTQQTDLEDAERRARVFRLIDELVGDQHRVVVMRFAEEKSIRQIAGELDRSEGAVKQLQFRALKSLREKLTRTRDE